MIFLKSSKIVFHPFKFMKLRNLYFIQLNAISYCIEKRGHFDVRFGEEEALIVMFFPGDIKTKKMADEGNMNNFSNISSEVFTTLWQGKIPEITDLNILDLLNSAVEISGSEISFQNETMEDNVNDQVFATLDSPTSNLELLPNASVLLDSNDFGITSAGNTLNEVPLELILTNHVSQPVVSTVHHLPSSLPASQNWPGVYDFNVSFTPQEKNTKGVSWTYSKTKDKLYVGKDAPCPINFSTNAAMPKGVKIRAMALYTNPESASEVVIRCVNHSLEEKSKNIFEAEHLVRCESSAATYEVDVSTKRHSVIVPFENPPAGQQFSTYIYKFTCFGSCPFGPNRRPLMLVFTLEKANQVIGRRKVDVKICACPGRDRKTDEQCLGNSSAGPSKKRKEPDSVNVSLAETFEFTKKVDIPIPKKIKSTPNQDGKYCLYVNDPECYEFLKQMKKLYDYCQTLSSMPPAMKKAFNNYYQRKGYNFPPDILNP